MRQRLTAGGDVRGMLAPEVLGYIRKKGLWEAKESYSADLDRRIAADPENVGLLIERGLEHYRHTQWGKALNDFHRALALLEQKDERTRRVVALRVQGIPYDRIAAELGISPGSARVIDCRARHWLKETLRKEGLL